MIFSVLFIYIMGWIVAITVPASDKPGWHYGWCRSASVGIMWTPKGDVAIFLLGLTVWRTPPKE
jgi:hypothetical protein